MSKQKVRVIDWLAVVKLVLFLSYCSGLLAIGAGLPYQLGGPHHFMDPVLAAMAVLVLGIIVPAVAIVMVCEISAAIMRSCTKEIEVDPDGPCPNHPVPGKYCDPDPHSLKRTGTMHCAWCGRKMTVEQQP